uniref:Uncharacterized protein n=1 Tax=Hordeum vulgare subsp. vulgare TaxID=112509 RepID=A0A8I7BC02_HORVV
MLLNGELSLLISEVFPPSLLYIVRGKFIERPWPLPAFQLSVYLLTPVLCCCVRYWCPVKFTLHIDTAPLYL